MDLEFIDKLKWLNCIFESTIQEKDYVHSAQKTINEIWAQWIWHYR